MKQQLIIFEDDKYADFYPITYLRPIYFLRPGIRLLYEKIIDSFDQFTPVFFCRDEIAAIVAEQVNLSVNNYDFEASDQIILVNGRLKGSQEFYEALLNASESVILKNGDDIAAAKIIGKLIPETMKSLRAGDLQSVFKNIENEAATMAVEVPFYNYLWDFIGDIHHAIRDDFDYFKAADSTTGFLISNENMRKEGREYDGVHMLQKEDIYISRDAEVMPGVVMDASHGPIFIGTRAKIEPNTYMKGPTYLGKESMLVGGKIDACSIGPVCRAGGEVEETILQGYSNKYHAGFLGHAYVGEWVNFGAMTTNSDLKNNYSPVSVSVNGKLLNSGSLKVGSFIGDFTKTAIGTMLNTGINIGLSCNLVPGGLIVEKEVPSFTWYSPKKTMKYNLKKALETIERSMERRGRELTTAMINRLTELYDS